MDGFHQFSSTTSSLEMCTCRFGTHRNPLKTSFPNTSRSCFMHISEGDMWNKVLLNASHKDAMRHHTYNKGCLLRRWRFTHLQRAFKCKSCWCTRVLHHTCQGVFWINWLILSWNLTPWLLCIPKFLLCLNKSELTKLGLNKCQVYSKLYILRRTSLFKNCQWIPNCWIHW